MSTVSYEVPGISCGHCTHTIQTEVGQLEGVSSVEASQSDKRVTVEFELPATEEKILGLLTEINYPPAL
ncbi:MAG: heavy-metal-associated domain-containing protein [Anaerolineales bacterium]|jgi:copper chaperone CopZ|nr:heavy-metal-associated domain-containing protein [Anaerolineales bacterium]